MKKILLFALVLSSWAACKNDAKPADATAETPVSTTTVPVATNPQEEAAMIEQNKGTVSNQYKAMNDLITDIDAMPAAFRNMPEIQAMRSDLGDMSGKAQMIMQKVSPTEEQTKSAQKNNGTMDHPERSPSAIDAKDAIESMARYNEMVMANRAKFDQFGRCV